MRVQIGVESSESGWLRSKQTSVASCEAVFKSLSPVFSYAVRSSFSLFFWFAKVRLTENADKMSSSLWGIVELSFREKQIQARETIRVFSSPYATENSHDYIA